MDDARIEQFRKMAESDPNNELGHFSLGRALLESGQFAPAAASLERVIELNPANSRAYQLLAAAQKGAGDAGAAVGTLRLGYDVANSRRDMAVIKDIAAMMQEMGEPVPEVEAEAAPAAAVGVGQVQCRRCGQAAPKLNERPFKGALGEQILASVCANCWHEWIRMGTKVINELRLDLMNPRHAEVYDHHMKEFLGLK
jgi:Fe-S cluster biosynthesis and repair protein YggX/cytochrome c-type biogenesis protein CcmH/NrfG